MFDTKDYIDMWRGVRVAEGARLESVYTLIAYRGFESLSLRHFFADPTPIVKAS